MRVPAGSSVCISLSWVKEGALALVAKKILPGLPTNDIGVWVYARRFHTCMGLLPVLQPHLVHFHDYRSPTADFVRSAACAAQPHSACMPGWDRHGELWHGARLEGNEFVGSAQWEGQEGWSEGDVLELQLDFNRGTLTAFKKNEGEMEELGLLAEGLGAHGELCWAVSVQGLGDVVSIARC